MDTVREHPTVGASILSGSRFPMLLMAEEIALQHHECWDGCGYPSGLRGEEIPLSARIVSIIDVFDSLTHVRPYKRAWSEDEALDEIERLAGTKFDPAVAEAFLRLHGRLGSSVTSESGEEGAE
jgi:putative two-component system response regulator